MPEAVCEPETLSALGAAAESGTISPFTILGMLANEQPRYSAAAMDESLARSFANEEIKKWPRAEFQYTIKFINTTISDGDELFHFAVVWSAPTAAAPVPKVVVNMTATAWADVVKGPSLTVKCKRCCSYVRLA